MTHRLHTRAFLICFVPFAAVLSGGFWIVKGHVESTVRDGLRASLRENQRALASLHSRSERENSRFLRVAGENAALKAGMALFQPNTDPGAARRTVEDQLRELGERMGFDLLLASGPSGAPLAGVMRESDAGSENQLAPMDVSQVVAGGGMILMKGHTYQIASVPVDLDDANLGTLKVGQRFDITEFTTPTVLTHQGDVIDTNIANVSGSELKSALGRCDEKSECDVRFEGQDWVSLPVQTFGNGFELRSLENVDQATAPVEAKLNSLFLILSGIGIGIAVLCSLGASQTIVKPIAAVVLNLRKAASTGVLPEFIGKASSVREIKELVEIYNRAAESVRAGGENLQAAYLEFVGSLANALDARDRYTSGHSRRVSELACATAAAMQLGPEDVERIRIGALLHDMGKIGIADHVLQKPGRLTDEEFALVKEHPVIGRRILEGVQGLAPFLPAVELHHENWDGTGYPKGQVEEETPIDARIIHVSDAYDAMTTDRSYRRGMTHERALAILQEEAGRQFDPRIVEVFSRLPRAILTGHSAEAEACDDAGLAVAELV